MNFEAGGGASSGPGLRVRTADSDRVLDGAATYSIGRDPKSDIVLADPRVSWAHAVLRHQDGGWLLEDAGSTNGTFIDEQRVRRVTISADCSVRLGHPADGPQLRCSPVNAPEREQVPVKVQAATALWAEDQQPPVAEQPSPDVRVPQPRQYQSRPPSAVVQMPVRVLRIGRAPDNDVVVSDLSVSRYHAELRRTNRGEFEIVDLDSHNGTFLNGQRVKVAPVTETDLIGVGPATFRRFGDQLQEFLDTGDISLSAQDLTFRLPSGKVLLDHVTFPLGERCLLGVIGPSGAGKSTLLGALTGIAPATDGTVLYDGRDLYKSYAELRHRIGLVPQENILHTQLTVRRALEFAAELRFPRDTSKQERKRRIDEVLQELALTAHADTRTSALSGGQQKRVNVALELLTKPSLLFLDEPTSGLDPGLDKSVMEQMAKLAHDGRTVIVVTHSVANLNLCDRLLVLVPGGKVAFFGPPADGLRHFGKPGWAEVFQAFEADPRRDWAGEFRSSPYYSRYVTAEVHNATPMQAPARPAQAAPKSRNSFAHLRTMCRRYLAVIASDRLYLGVLAGLPIALGLMVRVIPSPHGLVGPDNVDASSLLLVLAVGGVLSGTANAIWEIVKERAIYSRERAAGLSAGAYLMSKLVILGILSGLQAVVLVAVGLVGRPLPKHGAVLTSQPLVELMLAMFLLSVASMTLGLLISSIVDTSDKAMPLLVVVVMFQVVLSGGIFPLHGKVGLDQVSWLSPSRWGFAAAASTTNLNKVLPPTGLSLPAPSRGAHGARLTSASPAGLPGTAAVTLATLTLASHSRQHEAARAATAVASSNPAIARATGTASGDPLWDHTARAWLIDMAAMLVLALAFALLTGWRLAKMGPVKRR
ncbi:MAG TPA: FHA domain-containing protein [Streptosporangiaceae bacterium]|nr:FHA domain-containing protein [Streptosporangiaceae bacterium]